MSPQPLLESHGGATSALYFLTIETPPRITLNESVTSMSPQMPLAFYALESNGEFHGQIN
eukprot:891230-Prymnesium_polylepis.1